MPTDVLISSLARLLVGRDGLTAAYLPEGVSRSVAEALVREANVLRPSAEPYAVLIAREGHNLSDSQCLIMPASGLVRYRVGDRLAVAVGRPPELASVTTSFDERLGQSFPEGIGGEEAIRELVKLLVPLLLDAAGVETSEEGTLVDVASRLEACLMQLRSVHLAAVQTSQPWNSRWLEHVRLGVNGLREVIARQVAINPGKSVAGAFGEFTFPAFGLPTPTDGYRLKSGRSSVGRDLVEALREWWSDESTIADSIDLLSAAESGELHPLAAIDWAGFDKRLSSSGHLVDTWFTTVARSTDAVEALARLTEAQFFSPEPNDQALEGLWLQDPDGNLLGTNGDGVTEPFVVKGEVQNPSTSAASWCSEAITLVIPSDGIVTKENADTFNPDIAVAWPGALWETRESRPVDNTVHLTGHIVSWSGENMPPDSVVQTALTVTSLKPGPVLAAAAKASVRLLLLPSTEAGAVAFPLASNGAAGKSLTVATSSFLVGGEVENGPLSGDLASATRRHRVIVWANTGSMAFHEGREMARLNGRTGLFSTEFTPQGIDVIEVGDTVIHLNAPSDAVAVLSPLAAAIACQNPSTEVLAEREQFSLRGQYEAALLTNATSNTWLRALGHVALPASDAADMHEVAAHAGILVPPSLHAAWDDVVGTAVPDAIVDSVQAARFRQAFADLDPFGIETDPLLPEHARAPSRYPRRILWSDRRQALAEYLDSYSELIEAARTLGDPAAVFWATYPFSMSAWSFDHGDSGCKSVLLSPLHPLRIAWLAASESTLWDATYAENLAGTIQGFGFPFVGPSENTAAGMLAVPSDAGTDQIFLGWAHLVETSIAGHKSLVSPARIGGTAAPGSAASGLNANAVSAALRNYRRMNPHVSTLTIDLSSQAPSPRLLEIDDAVVSALTRWERTREDRLPGGARVLDSVHRRGPMPVEAITVLARSNGAAPLSWSRYSPTSGKSTVCNVRLLQDAGVRVRVRPAVGEEGGVLAHVPLRRYEASIASSAAAGTVSLPGVALSGAWSPLVRALELVEGEVQVESKLFGSALVDTNADWTVSGESMLSPSAIASMLGSEAKSRMLWEWRPPEFERAAGLPALDRRPYVSVARIPMSFSEQIQGMLSKAKGTQATSEDAQSLFATLGSRGVGLSSLLAMGGTHASGALGFYLGFALLDSVSAQGHQRFVLPIDACDSFLLALAAQNKHAGTKQRADLLLVDVSDSGVTLVPIEIKFYGLGAEASSGSLPNPNSAALGEPLRQLGSTFALLQEIVSKRAEFVAAKDEASLALWSNGLAALVDAGARMTPGSNSDASSWKRRFSDIANGLLPIRTGSPLVMYFNHDASYADGTKFKAFHLETADLPAGLKAFGGLIADSATVFSSLGDTGHVLTHEWSEAVQWAVEGTSVHAAPPELQPLDQVETRPKAVPPSVETLPEHDSESEHETEVTTPKSALSVPASGLGNEDAIAPEVSVVPLSETRSSRREIDEKGIRFPVGTITGSLGRGPAYFWPSNTELNQMNIGVVGDLGTGKTQLLKSLVFRLRQEATRFQDNPLSFLIFDYKQDFQDTKFINAVGGEVLHPQSIPLNFFALPGQFTPHKAVQRATMFCDVIGKIYGGVGPVQRTNLIKAIVGGYTGDQHVPPTLAEVLAAYEAASGKPDAVSSILTSFVMAEIFSEDKAELVPFEKLIEDKVLVLALSDLGVDQEGKNALVVLFLNMYYDYMLRSTKWPYVGAVPQLRRLNSFLLVDEATNIMSYEFPVLMQLMLQGREFGFGTMLASQYLSHFRTSRVNYGEPLLTWFIHKVPNVTPKELAQLGIKGLPDTTAERIARIGVHEALYSSLEYPGTFISGTPFYQLVGDLDQDDLDEVEGEAL